MIIHFDGDLLVYRCGFAAEKLHRYLTLFDEYEEETVHHFQYKKDMMKWLEANKSKYVRCEVEEVREAEPVENALHNVRLMVNDTLKKLACSNDDLIMYLSGDTNYRDGVATIKPYKGNRKDTHKPVHGPAIREYMKERYDVVVSEDEEADDIVGYSHYAMYLRDAHSSVICTVDKDIDMIPGMHYNFIKGESYYVDDDQADRYFYMQLLTGDATDNIPGLPKVGPKTAAKMLKGVEGVTDMYKVARTAYMGAYDDGLGALIENARLLWIRREADQWWQPPVEEDRDNA